MFRLTLLILFLVAHVVKIMSAPLGAPPQHQTPVTSNSKQTSLQNSDLVVPTKTVPVSEETDKKVKDDLEVQTKHITQVTGKFNDEIVTNESDKKISVSGPILASTRPSNIRELLTQARQKFLSQNDKRKSDLALIQPQRRRANHMLVKSSEEQRIRSRNTLLSRLRKLSRNSLYLENSSIISGNISKGFSNKPNNQQNTNITTTTNSVIVSDAKRMDYTNENISEQPKSSNEIPINGPLTDGVSGTTSITVNDDLVTNIKISPQEYFRQQQFGVEFPALQSNLSELVRDTSVPIKPQGRSLSNVLPINIIEQDTSNLNKDSMQKLQPTTKSSNKSVFSSFLVDRSQQIMSIEKGHRTNFDNIIQTTEPSQLAITDATSETIVGHYEELHPGQYHEINPGQYHEVNPGQYSEINPGQYHETNPGQYTEVNPGQVELEVEVNEEESIKTYNVHKKTGDYIIGEVGKIDISNGQTLEGVRYTAVDGILDQKKISEILQHYFGTQTSR